LALAPSFHLACCMSCRLFQGAEWEALLKQSRISSTLSARSVGRLCSAGFMVRM
ncbi:hypothetical protein BaRGS_00014806, partial [Batillaria attramentaria]